MEVRGAPYRVITETEWYCIGQPHQQVTIETLPDDVLLKIFKSTVDAMYADYYQSQQWRVLVHVCRRWRNLLFTFARHLNLRLLLKPSKRSVKAMLDIWPELPIYIYALDCSTKEVRDNTAAALRLIHRVSGIRFDSSSSLDWGTFVSLMQHPLPVLTHLWVQPSISGNYSIPRSFLGGSAPSLQDLLLADVPFPALPELLLSTTNLVRLLYDNIPRAGYICPQAMVTSLSALTRLESLCLTFLSPQSVPDRSIQILPPHTRTLLPALTYFRYRGDTKYMEDLVAQLDAPILESMVITLFHERVLEVSELAKFVRRADKLSLVDRAKVTFGPDCISLTLSQELLVGRVDPKTLMLNPTCSEPELRLSYLARFCASCLPTFSPFRCLYILAPHHDTWKDVKDDPDPQWLELLRLFNLVKDLRLSYYIAPHIAEVLRKLPAERITEVLPALENLFISGIEPSGPMREAIFGFSDARELSGHPVSIYDWEGRERVTRWSTSARWNISEFVGLVVRRFPSSLP